MALQARTLEIFDDLGIVDRMLQKGHKIHGANIYAEGQRILHFSFDELPTPYPFALDLPQDETERILTQHLNSLGVAVEHAHAVTGVHQNDSGVTMFVQMPDTHIEKLRARYVIGCDGAHSTIRHATGMPFEGSVVEESFAVADVALQWEGPDDEWNFWLNEDGLFGLFPMGGGRYRVVASAPADATPDSALLRELFERRGPKAAAVGEPANAALYRISHRRVASYQHGRVFVAGDAAHVQSPAGSQGMNTGIQDAYNLGWKIGMHYRGNAPDSLLASYGAEREPVGRAVLSLTDNMAAIASLRHPISQGIRNRLLPVLAGFEVLEHRLVNRLAEISVNYRGSPIVGQFGRWYAAGPWPGDRALDVKLADGRRLFDMLRGTRHVALLFAAEHWDEEDTRGFENIVRYMEDGYPDEVETHLVARKPVEWQGSVILDTSGAAHHAYAAGVPCVYLIRPDGYVGFRSLSSDPLPLLEHLNRVYEPES
jgi:2-polyprenyl-6-methoxyphenol hydroxylase-like FAD-dependent oxidoreductase